MSDGKRKPDHLRILNALRRIKRFNQLHSRSLLSEFEITGPQLVCLLAIHAHDGITATGLAREIHLSPSTVVGIIDRLEVKGIVRRKRDTSDRRVVHIQTTKKGEKILARSPSPMQELLFKRFQSLEEEEQEQIMAALDTLVGLMSEVESEKDRVGDLVVESEVP